MYEKDAIRVKKKHLKAKTEFDRSVLSFILSKIRGTCCVCSRVMWGRKQIHHTFQPEKLSLDNYGSINHWIWLVMPYKRRDKKLLSPEVKCKMSQICVAFNLPFHWEKCRVCKKNAITEALVTVPKPPLSGIKRSYLSYLS